MPEQAATPRDPPSLRPGLLDFYLIRGVAGPFVAITLGVGLLMMLERALRLIHEMAASGADVSYFLPLLVRLAPYYLDLALPAAFMVALVLLVARLDDHLELEAMLGAGFSLARIAMPLALVGLVIAAAGLVAGGWLEPVGRYEFRAMRVEALNAGRIGRLHPRAFYHPAESLALSFERRAADGRIEGIFLWQRLPDGRELALTGESGRIGFLPEGRRFGIDLAAGRYLAQRPNARDGTPDLVAFHSMAFRESLRVEDSSWRRGWDQNELTLSELAAAARGGSEIPRRALEAEYYSRIARAASIPLIPFLVLPLAFATKKGRRGLGILVGGAALAAFHHGMNFARQLGLSGAAEPRIAIFGMAALSAAIILIIFVSGRHLPSHSPIAGALKPVGEALARLRGRGRARSLRGRTLSSYLAWRLAIWTAAAAAAIVALLQMVDIFDRGEEFVERGMGLAGIAHYAWLRLPPMLLQALPIATLAGAMTVFVALGRSREMVAIRAAGISQYRVLLMALPVPLLLAGASLLLAEVAVPRSQAAFTAWWRQGEPEEAAVRWFRIGGEIVRARAASEGGRRLGDIEIFRRDRRGLLTERLSAASAEAGSAGWVLSDVERLRFADGRTLGGRAARLGWDTPLAPADVILFFSATPQLSAAAALRSLGREAPVSQSEALFETQLFRSAAGPLAPLVMLLLALPLAFTAPRRGVAWPALLYAGGGGLLYLVADGVLTVAAQIGALPPAVGAWAAPLLFGLGAFTVLVYFER